MAKFVATVKRFLVSEEGASAVEYGLLVALIAGVMIAGATTLGVNINAILVSVANATAGAAGA